MRVLLYYPWIYVKSGIERSIIELKRCSRHEIRIFTNHYDAQATYPELKEMDVVELRRVSVKRTYWTVGAAALNILRTRFDVSEADVLVVCCDGLGPLVTFRHRSVPIVNLCFTPLRAIYDLDYRERLLSRGPLVRIIQLASEAAFRVIDRAAWRNFAAVMCISETIRDRVAAGALFPRNAMEVVYPGVRTAQIRASDTFERFFLLPGRIMWTKNIELAISAFRLFLEQAPAELRDFRLHIAGMIDRKSLPYHQSLRKLAAGIEQITFETKVSERRMEELYQRCWAVLAPAFNEDFGITPIEGMARGKATIACNRGGLRESLKDGITGYLVEPEPAPFAAALRRLAQDEPLARKLGAQAVARASNFTWDEFVRRIDDKLEQLVG